VELVPENGDPKDCEREEGTYIVTTSGTWIASTVGVAALTLVSLAAAGCGNNDGRQAETAAAVAKPSAPQTAVMTFRIDKMRRVNGAL